jgi:hypothetical protein
MTRDALRREQRPQLMYFVDLVTLLVFLDGGTEGSCSGWRAFVETRRRFSHYCVAHSQCGEDRRTGGGRLLYQQHSPARQHSGSSVIWF